MTTRAELVHECARRIDCGHNSARLSLAAATLDGDGELRERLTVLVARWREACKWMACRAEDDAAGGALKDCADELSELLMEVP